MLDKKKNPLVSIIVNCYNGEKYLNETLKSIESQTYKDYEVIFWDNCSTDNSSKIFHKFKNPKFKYFSSHNKVKLYDARNMALNECNGEIITFLDVDDLWKNNKLQMQVYEIQKNPEVGLIYSFYEILDEKRNKLKLIKLAANQDIKNFLLKKYNIALVSIAIRRQVLKKLNLKFNSNFNIIGDFDLVLKLSNFCKFKLIKKNLCTYRDHVESETNRNYVELIEELEIWYEKNKNEEMFSNCNNFNHIKSKIKNYMKRKEFDKFMSNMNELNNNIYKLKLYIKYILNKLA
ncbi:glycosyltransferase [Candidatus Pelagibacter sp.]|nr:glycosyltransferase [Candidatus Pelagibacter sp.]